MVPKRVAFLLSVWMLYSISYAQKDTNWQKGLVITHSKDTLAGQVNYDLTKSVIQVDTEDKFRALDDRSIEFMVIHDEENSIKKTYRKYHDPRKQLFQSKLLEQIETGDIHFLKKSTYITYRSAAMNYPYGKRETIRKTYYLWYEDQLLKVKNFKKQIRSLTGNNYNEVQKFVMKKGLNYRNPKDQAAIINYLNQFSDDSIARSKSGTKKSKN